MPTESALDLAYWGDPVVGSTVLVPSRTTNGTYNVYNVTLTGGSGSDALFGFNGPYNWAQFNPTGNPLNPLAVNNTLIGGDGDDRIYSSFRLVLPVADQSLIYARHDTLIGGAGNDIYILRDNNVSIVELSGSGGGIDTIVVDATYASRTGLTALDLSNFANVENVWMGASQSFTVYGSEAANTLVGNLGDDTLLGLGGDDRLAGGAGNDSLSGGAGNDALWGGDGNDTIVAGDGTDTLSGGNGDDVLSGEAGNDIIYDGLGNDSLNGGAGNDVLYGGDGNDTIVAGDGTDTLSGGIGNDVLSGGDGNDTLSGGNID